jgi:4-hydroxyacetophenone monooxygenase
MIQSTDRPPPLHRDELRTALQAGNIPCLLPMLYQLTGEDRWLQPPYFPARTRGFEPLDCGGLPEAVQMEIREAAEEALMAWSARRAPAVPVPNDQQLRDLMSVCLGEPVPEEFAPMVAEHLGLRPFVPVDVRAALGKRGADFHVLIIGAGVSGLSAAFLLKKAGVPFTVIEKNTEVGGTWWENRYPGARVDIPSDLYSFSFAPKNWSEHFGQRDELAQYFVDAVKHFDVRSAIQFGSEVEAMRWDESAQHWCLRVARAGQTYELTANAVVTATGIHNRPKTPNIPGLKEFTGEVIHSAVWPEGANIEGRRVAVVGTGASAMQVVNSIASKVSSLLVVQRTPHWVAPNENYFKKTAAHKHYLFSHAPFYRGWHRFRLYWFYTERLFAALVVDPKWDNGGKSVSKVNEVYREFLTQYLRASLKDREDLQTKSLPNYPPFGKRILIDNGWFAVLKKPHVELLADDVGRLMSKSIITSSGVEREIDTLILCTGFEQQRFLYPIEIFGRNGRELRGEWEDDDARAFLGIASPGFPNLFYLYGPNTNPGSGSYINTAEAQARYVTQLLTRMVTENIASLECKVEPYEAYNRRLDEANARMVYAQPGVHNYYRNTRGRVVTNSPWPTLEYWKLTKAPSLNDYVAVGVKRT